MAALRSSALLYSAEKEFRRFGPQAGHVNIPLRSAKTIHYKNEKKENGDGH
jgi:hypothetical protein